MRWLLLTASLVAASAYSSGPPGCVNQPGHGGSFTANTNRFSFTVTDASGNAVSAYVPGAVHTITIQPAAGVTFKGMLFGVFAGGTKPADMNSSPKAGSSLTAISPNAGPVCTGTIGHTLNTIKTSFQASWVAPAAGSGAVYINGIVVETKPLYYQVGLSLPEGAAPAASNSPAAPSISASGTESPSPVPPSITASGTAAMTVSPSFGASPSSSVAASTTPTVSPTPSPSTVSYPSSTPITESLTLKWRVDDVAGTVSYRLEAQGNRWLAIGRANCNGMLNRITVSGGCSAPVVLGRPAWGSTPSLMILGSKTVAGITPIAAGVTNTILTNPTPPVVSYDAASDKTIMTFTRPKAIPAGAHASELSINPTNSDGYIWAVGSSATFGYHQSSGFINLQLSPPSCTRDTTCSSHGSCVGTGCVCDVGYTGPSCSTCDSGFSRSSPTAACQPAPAASAADVSIVVGMRLLQNYSAVAGQPSTALRNNFVTMLTQELATALSVDSSRIVIQSVKEGSIMVQVVIMPPPASGSTATSAPALAVSLASMLSSTGGGNAVLGPLLSSNDPSTPLSFSAHVVGPGSYANTVSLLSGAVKVSWTIQGTGSTATIAMKMMLSGPDSNKWFAFGVSSSQSMIGGDCLVYEPGRSTGQVRQQTIGSRTSAGVVPVPAASQPFSSATVTTGSDGSVSVEIVRPLAAGSYSGALAIPASGAVPIVVAVGSTGQGTVSRHASGNGVAGSLDFSSGALAVTPTPPLRVAHGVIMTIAWGILAPLGILLARYGKTLQPSTGPQARWFVLHRIIQSTASILSLIGFILALVMVSPGPHFNIPHAALGLFVVILGAWQPMNAVLRPHKPPAGQPVPFIRRAWEILHKGSGYLAVVCACAAIFLGFPAIGAQATALPGLYGALVAIILTVALWREAILRGCCQKTQVKRVVETRLDRVSLAGRQTLQLKMRTFESSNPIALVQAQDTETFPENKARFSATPTGATV